VDITVDTQVLLLKYIRPSY